MTGWMGDDKHGENGVLKDAYKPANPEHVAIVRRQLAERGLTDVLAEMIGVARG